MSVTDLYPWQEECLKKWFSNHGRGMVQAATGAGKTILALAAAKQLEQTLNLELHIKIVVPTGALLRQWSRAVKKYVASSLSSDEGLSDVSRPFADIGLRGDGFRMSDNRKYMIYVINSARYELARQILFELQNGKAVFLIADECHHYSSEQNRLIFEFLPYADAFRDRFFSLGLSATLPSGQAQDYLASVLGRKIYDYSISQAVAHKNICSYDIFHIALPFDAAEQRQYQIITRRMRSLHRVLFKARPDLRNLSQKDFFRQLSLLAKGKDPKLAAAAGQYTAFSYRRKHLVCLASARIQCACELLNRLPRREKILIFGERIQQAEELYRRLNGQYPGQIGRYHSQMSSMANKNTLERFQNGELRILITCKALDEGFDVPDACVGIILSGTSMQRQRIQRMGRLLRKKAGKEKISLYYLHIAESMEEKWFLPDAGAYRIVDIEFRPAAQDFHNARYEAAASRIAASAQTEQLSPEMKKELNRCLRLGIVRSDWLLDSNSLRDKILTASSLEDRNYWICMKRLKMADDSVRAAASA